MKDKTTAALLAIFLGGIGAHKFYLGNLITGLIYLFFCWTFIPAVLGLIEGIYYLAMDDVAFQRRFHGPTFVLTSEGIATPDTHVRCPDCRELVRKDARKCKHCGTALIPQE